MTGKPVTQGGVRGRKEATDRNVGFGSPESPGNPRGFQESGLVPGLDGKTVAIQGFGNVGYHAAKFMAESGAKVVAVGEWNGGVHDPRD